MEDIKNFNDVVGLVNSTIMNFYSNHGYVLSDEMEKLITKAVYGMLENRNLGFIQQESTIKSITIVINDTKLVININMINAYERIYKGEYIIDLSTLF